MSSDNQCKSENHIYNVYLCNPTPCGQFNQFNQADVHTAENVSCDENNKKAGVDARFVYMSVHNTKTTASLSGDHNIDMSVRDYSNHYLKLKESLSGCDRMINIEKGEGSSVSPFQPDSNNHYNDIGGCDQMTNNYVSPVAWATVSYPACNPINSDYDNTIDIYENSDRTRDNDNGDGSSVASATTLHSVSNSIDNSYDYIIDIYGNNDFMNNDNGDGSSVACATTFHPVRNSIDDDYSIIDI